MRAAKDPEQNRIFQAERAQRCWVKDEIHALFSQLHNQEILSRLGVKWLHGVTTVDEQQVDTLTSFWKLTVCMCSERAWFMLHYSDTGPEQFAGALATSPDDESQESESHNSWVHVVDSAELVLSAERALGDETHADRIATYSWLKYCISCLVSVLVHLILEIVVVYCWVDLSGTHTHPKRWLRDEPRFMIFEVGETLQINPSSLLNQYQQPTRI